MDLLGTEGKWERTREDFLTAKCLVCHRIIPKIVDRELCPLVQFTGTYVRAVALARNNVSQPTHVTAFHKS